MTGRVLTEEEISAIYEYSLERFVDQDVIESLIATIRDREEMVGSWRRVCEKLEQQNTILREALEQICRCDALKVIVWAEVNERDISERDYLIHIAREALTKVSQKEASSPDEPNRNAQTE